MQERFLLHVPLQIFALSLATLCVPQICGYLCSTDNVIRYAGPPGSLSLTCFTGPALHAMHVHIVHATFTSINNDC